MTRRTQLGFALDFTADDLAANQQGTISEAQLKHLRRELAITALGGGVFTLVSLGFVVALVNTGGHFLLVLIMLLIALFLGGTTWVLSREKWVDLRGGVVLSASGITQTRKEPRARIGYAFFATIDTLEFRIEPPAYYAFYPGNRYQVFYTPAEKRILSAVRLDDTPES